MESKAEITKAIVAVMKEVAGVEKNMTVGEGKNAYNAVSDKDVKEVVRKIMCKHGLCLLPLEINETTDVTRWEEQTQWGAKTKQSVFVKVINKYLLAHESGESIVLMGYGHGIDSQDKAAGKACTYALKNLLIYSFLIPTGKIDDTDAEHSDNIPVAPINKKQDIKDQILFSIEQCKNAIDLTNLYHIKKDVFTAHPELLTAMTAKKNSLTPVNK